MSSLYLDVLKDRLYTAGRTSKLRRSAQSVLYEILRSLTGLLAPVCPFTAEEIYQLFLKEKGNEVESVHMSLWPKIKEDYLFSESDVSDMAKLLDFRPAVLKALEEKRAQGEIGSPLEAKLILSFKEEGDCRLFEKFSDQLPFIFIVSQAEVMLDKDQDFPFSVSIVKAEGKKCPRCWNYSSDLEGTKKYPGICSRCVTAVKDK